MIDDIDDHFGDSVPDAPHGRSTGGTLISLALGADAVSIWTAVYWSTVRDEQAHWT